MYPEQSPFEKDKEYLDLAKILRYKVVFTSLLYFVNHSDQECKQNKVLKAIKYAYDIGFIQFQKLKKSI
ncbi:MupG family TIM beta-alpha barrel fold protein [Mesoplasma chauliocola]|uniref:MupG family TIM beta-alpha barrel fold protein n=1 Tax=Mesoplasma chauliocola TaxID=216427 RepID=UPI003B848881